MPTDEQATSRYEIRVQGRLAPRWAAWFDGMTLTDAPGGVTVIHGPVVDQAALHGLLQKLRDIGLPLLSVTPTTGPPDATVPAPRQTTPRSTMSRTDHRTPLTSTRRTALVAGAFYLLTFVSIPTLALYAPVHEPGYVSGPGPDGPVILGGVLELVVALACIGTAVALYPVVKRQDGALALGFVGTRILEAATIVGGVVALFSVVTLRQSGVGPAADVTGQALVALHDWFRMGQAYLPAFNALLLGTLLYRSRLVPRFLPTLGLVGAPLLIVASSAQMFGGSDSPVWGLLVLPIATWELSLGVYLVVKGFRPSPITAAIDAAAGRAPSAPDEHVLVTAAGRSH